MFNELVKYASKPELYAKGTNSLWDDEHISKGMLEAHLNPEWDAASRNHAFINESVRWIAEIAPPSQYGKLLDLGCGPGLYAERLSTAGYSVTGIDFSKRSIEYAREQAKLNGSDIEYICEDYTKISYAKKYNIIILIYCDYAVFSSTDRQVLLGSIYRALKTGGKFIFDVFTPKMRHSESRSWEYCENGGFFSDKPHIHLEAVFQYDDDDKTELGQNIVITDEKVECYRIYDHFFDKDSLISEVQNSGFASFELYDDVAGKDFSGKGETICCVMTK